MRKKLLFAIISALIILYSGTQIKDVSAASIPMETVYGHLDIDVEKSSVGSTAFSLSIAKPEDDYLYSYDMRLAVKIGNETYYSSYDQETDVKDDTLLWQYNVSYPEQEEGTKFTYWFEYRNRDFVNKTEKIYKSTEVQSEIQYDYCLDDAIDTYRINQTTLELKARYYLILGDDSDKAKVRAVAEIGDNKYYSDYKKENYDGYDFIVNYPEQKPGTAVTFYIEDARGDKTEPETEVLEYDDEPIELEDFDSKTKVLKGTTYKNLDITVKYGKKTKKTKSDKKGRFKITTGYLSADTEVTVTTEDSVGNKESVTFLVPRAYDSIVCVNSTVTRNSTKVKVYADDVNKGDYLILKIGRKSYKLRIKKEKREFNGTIKINKPSTGQKVSLVLYSKAGKVVERASDEKVYYDSDARVGMTKSQVKKTVLGKPDEITTSTNGWELWVYYWNDYKSATYVYFNNGKVVEVNDVNI